MNMNLLSKPFVISKTNLSKMNLLSESTKLTHGYLYYNEETNVCIENEKGTSIFLIGYILDIRDAYLSFKDILKNLIEKYNISHDLFYEELKYLNGRYVLIVDCKTDTRIYSDATVLRPIFYWNKRILASHEFLLREVIKQEHFIDLEVSSFNLKSFLDYTNTKDIYKFNPNLYFSLKDLKFTRFYPKEDFHNREFNNIVKETINYYIPQVDWLNQHYEKINFSLTGGFDSKFSLAIIKPILKKVYFFSYMYNFQDNGDYENLSLHKKVYYRDKFILDQLTFNFNLNHRYFYFEDYKVPEEYLKEIKKQVTSNHSYVLSYLTRQEFNSGEIHVKSTLFELAKIPSRRHLYTNNESIIKRIQLWAPKELRDDFEQLNAMFTSYYERNQLQEIVEKDYDIFLILYWEFRMGNWHSNITQETDQILETFILVNNRYMLDQFLSLTEKDRKANRYIKEIIKTFWPALNYFIPNTFKSLEDVLEEHNFSNKI